MRMTYPRKATFTLEADMTLEEWISVKEALRASPAHRTIAVQLLVSDICNLVDQAEREFLADHRLARP